MTVHTKPQVSRAYKVLDRQRLTLEAMMTRIDAIPRRGRPGEQQRLLAAQSEALGAAIRLIQDELTRLTQMADLKQSAGGAGDGTH